jgi:hypothetical protein
MYIKTLSKLFQSYVVTKIPPLTANIFVNATLMGKYEPEEMWKSLIDAYDIESRTYQSGFM